MDWVSQNWFWVMLVALFVAAHLFGHGGHAGCGGGHEGHRASDDTAPGKPQAHEH